MKNAGRETQQKISSASALVKSAPALPLVTPAHGASCERLSLSARRASERVRILARIFRAVDLHVEQSHGALPQFRKFARRWRGSVYRSDPSRPLKLSVATLRRIYYRNWLRSGRQVPALHHRYGANVPRFAFTVAQRQRLHAALLVARTISELHRAVFFRSRRPASRRVFCGCFTADERQLLCATFAARRHHGADEQRFTAWLRDPSRSFTAANGKGAAPK